MAYRQLTPYAGLNVLWGNLEGQEGKIDREITTMLLGLALYLGEYLRQERASRGSPEGRSAK